MVIRLIWLLSYLFASVFLEAFAQANDHSLVKQKSAAVKVRVTKLINLGDSLTDTGNFYEYSQYLSGVEKVKCPAKASIYPGIVEWIPSYFFRIGGLTTLPDKPYWQGRFSDGAVYLELLADSMGLNNTGDFINYAFGGSLSISYWSYLTSFARLIYSGNASPYYQSVALSFVSGKWIQVDLQRQAREALANYIKPGTNDLVMISSTGCDYVWEFWDPEVIVSSQYEVIRQFLNHGVKNLIWGTLPDITNVPCLLNSEKKASIRTLVAYHNHLTIRQYYKLVKEYPDVFILLLNMQRIFEILLEQADNLQIKRTTGCLPVSFVGCHDTGFSDIRYCRDIRPCQNSDDYFFWDSIHPGKRAHRWLAVIICHILASEKFDIACPVENDFDGEELAQRYFIENRQTVMGGSLWSE